MDGKKHRILISVMFAVLLTAASIAMAAGSGWTVTPSPSPGSTNFLQGVAASSSTDAWAVGYDYDANDHQFTITQHWDGNKWSLTPSPSPGTGRKCGDPAYAGNTLYGVAAVASNDVWAVGQICTYSNSLTLTEHWNGTQWTVIPSPNEPGQNADTLVAVAAVATNDVWAVGNYEILGGYHWNTLVEHWDGTKWSVVESPNPSGAYESFLNAIAVVSPADIWAVGYSVGNNLQTYQVPLIEHYDGQSWTIVPSPFPAPSDYNALYGLTAISANDVWAVGYANENTHGQNGEALIEHWDGTQWNLVDSPIAGNATLLLAATALSSTDVWSVGYIQTGSVQFLPVTEHWDGTSWRVARPPNPGKVAQLFSVAAANGKVWAVGAYSKTPMKFGYMENPRTLTMQR
jgi:hypothetical protein